MEEAEKTLLGLPELPKMEIHSPPLSHSDDDDETEADDSDGEEEEGGAGVGAGGGGGGAGVGGPPLKKGPWTPDEDKRLKTYVEAHGEGNWNQVQRNAGLNRCGKSCRLRWANHLRPNLKKGPFSKEEEQMVIELHARHGNKWAKMAGYLEGRTDNEIKNFWNTRSKRLSKAGQDLYPDGLLSWVANQDMNCHSPDDSHGKKRQNELSQGNGLDLDDIIFEKLDYKKTENYLAPFYTDPLTVDAMNPLKCQASSSSIGAGYNGSLTIEPFPEQPEKTHNSIDMNSGIIKNQFASSSPILHSSFSMPGTFQRPMKIELPSFQCHTEVNGPSSCQIQPASEYDDTLVYFPKPDLLQSQYLPSQNNGSMDFLVQAGHGPGDHSMPQGSFSSTFGVNLHESGSLVVFRSSKSPASPDAPSVDNKYYADYMSPDKYMSYSLDACRPDASPGARILSEDSSHSKYQINPCSFDAPQGAGVLNEVSSRSEFQPVNGPYDPILFGDSFWSSTAGHDHQIELKPNWQRMPSVRHV